MSEESLFAAALEKESPAERQAFLDTACAGDAVLRQRLERLLAADRRDRGILEYGMGPAVPAPTLAPDRVFAGRFTLREKLGEGGMGDVWVADEHAPVQRRVALKIVRAGFDSGRLLARFDQERQALALMDHPNIAKVLDAGIDETGRSYFAMELIQGVPITTYCDQAKLPPRRRLELFIAVCHAVQHAHQKGIIHRDLKPSNILVGLYDGTAVPKVIDFGVAKATGPRLTEQSIATEVGALIGTPEYMSPEQAELNNVDIDTRSDIYALGVVLYELLAGGPPFARKEVGQGGVLEMLRVIREQEPARPSTKLSTAEGLAKLAANRSTEPARLTKMVRGELDWIVMKALEKDRTRRYETANGFAMDLQRYLANEPVLACPPSAAYRLQKFVRRNRGSVLAAALLLLALVGGIIGTTWGLVRAEEAWHAEAQRAEGERLANLDAQAARAQALKRLAQIEKGNEILLSIFADLDIRRIRNGTEPVEAVLAQRLVQAGAQLDEDTVGDALLVAGLQDRLGVTLLGLGYAEDAMALLVKARDGVSARLPADHPHTLTVMSNLAASYREAGKPDVAAALLESTLRLRQAKPALADHPATLKVMSNLALAYQDAGKLDLALPLLEDALQLGRESSGPSHPDTLGSMNLLAGAYQAATKLDRAVPLFKETLELRRETLGEDHPDTLRTMQHLATCYLDAGKLDLAVPLYEGTLDRMKAKLGATHPDTLTCMNGLAASYRAAGKHDRALALHEQTLNLRKAKLGDEHPDTLMSMHDQAYAYHDAKKLDLAVPLYEDTLRLMIAKLGHDHPKTLMAMNNLAVAYKSAGKHDRALPLLRDNLEVTKAKLGAEHPHTITGMNNLAMAYQAARQPELALPLLRQASASVEKSGFEHAHAERIVPNLIACHEQLRQFAQAETWRRKWLVVVRQRSGADSAAAATQLSALGSILLRQEKWTDAEAVLCECLAIRMDRHPDTWTTFNTRAMLGSALLGQKKYAEAAPLLVQGCAGMLKREAQVPARSRSVLTVALERLVQLYDEQEMKEQADEWRQKLRVHRQGGKQSPK
jgi:serine/threonine protein kinase